jgi:hypothetical protein
MLSDTNVQISFSYFFLSGVQLFFYYVEGSLTMLNIVDKSEA